MKKVTEKKKFRLKKSARLTIAGACAATALVVAVIPTRNIEAITDPSTEIPATVDEALAVETLVGNANTVIPGDTAKFWAFPMGGKVEIADVNGNLHKYYEIDTTGMAMLDGPVPLFEISEKQGLTMPQCIKHYVGGDGSGYSPAGGVLSLSPAVIYEDDQHIPAGSSEAVVDVYITLDKQDELNHQPYIYKRYTETKHRHDPNDQMIECDPNYQTFDHTPKYYYYDIKVETWESPWTKQEWLDPTDPNYWVKPVDPTGDPAQDVTTIGPYCKQGAIVQYIANGAFKGVANFKQMQILDPEEGSGVDGITDIGDSAFEDCTSLQTITFGTNFKNLGTKAFYNCTGLKEINFGMSTLSIGDGCFADCTQLSTVSLPKTLQQLGTAAFMNCRSLTDAVPDFLTHDDYNSVLFGGNPDAGEMGINNNLATGSYAFCNCINLTTTKMCQTNNPIVGTYGQYGMYAGCINLNQIELPKHREGFKTTPSMFLGCPNLTCVRGSDGIYTVTCEDGQFINSVNESYFPGKEKNVSDSFVVWGPNPKDNSSIAILNFAMKNSLPYKYYDKTDNKFKYIMVEDETYKFTFTDDMVVESITELPTGTATTLVIPASIGGMPIAAVGDDACGKVDHGTYVTNLTKPKLIKISDAIATIGENAFRNCKSVEEVDFYHIPFTTSAAQTTIGSSCFKDCSNLDVIKFRDDNFNGNGYYDINIDASSVGTDAFLTENPNGLTMYGKMEQGYWPYEYALNPENISCSTVADSYITYNSGNPQNLSCRYSRPDSSKPGYVSLLEYPITKTVVGTEAVETPAGSGHFVETPVTIKDLIIRYTNGEVLTPNQEQIINQYTKSIYVPYGITSIVNAKNNVGTGNDYFIGTNDDETGHEYNLTSITFESLESLPSIGTDSGKPFSKCRGLQSITFNGNIKSIGELPFYNLTDDPADPSTEALSELSNVVFNGEGDKQSATIDDPYFWCENGIIYSYYVDDGKGVTTLEEVLQSRGKPGGVGTAQIDVTNDPSLADIDKIAEEAFKNCDYIISVDFTGCDDLKTIPEECFFSCSQISPNKTGLKYVTLPANIREVQPDSFQENDYLSDITIRGKAINIDETAFTDTESTTFHAYEDSSVPSYVKMVNKKEHRSSADELKYEQLTDEIKYTIIFIDGIDYAEFYRKTVSEGEDVAPPTAPSHANYTFTEYYSDPPNAWINVQQNATVYAKYTPINTSSTSTTSSTGGGSTGSKTGSTTSGSSSHSSSRSTSITSTTVQPVIVSGTGTPNGAGAVPVVNTAANTGNKTSGGAGTSNNVGKTKLISTTGGITDTSKMSATVNGSSDNYVIKISETQEANEMADKALTAAFGSLDAIRYLPIDISLYDSTGTQKISPIPAGVSINITMPIPDNLAIYGGNAKIACTEGGTLDKIQPKFTVINGVPCMNYTVTHLSPYVVYVDTNNLTATGTLDATPKTGDPIHPKWFLVIGLAAVSGVMFLMRDKKETVEAA